MITRYPGTPEIFAFISQSTFLMDLINHLCSNSVAKIDQYNSFAETFVLSNLSGVGLITTLKQNPPTKKWNGTLLCTCKTDTKSDWQQLYGKAMVSVTLNASLFPVCKLSYWTCWKGDNDNFTSINFFEKEYVDYSLPLSTLTVNSPSVRSSYYEY